MTDWGGLLSCFLSCKKKKKKVTAQSKLTSTLYFWNAYSEPEKIVNVTCEQIINVEFVLNREKEGLLALKM